ncbi:type II secretion system protein J (GspJ) [Alteromonadaceae bacterium Bs31]|nr:type II secretion system protein J (GspJ) [Alteromonadaceae bacterium Bs31]
MSSRAGFAWAPQRGITLLEVLIATVIMATIATLAFSSLDVSERSAEISEEKMLQIQQFDRVWMMLENDLRNIRAMVTGTEFTEKVPAMNVSYGDQYNLVFTRAGRSNPLFFPRTELARVGYRLEDGVLWRDVWVDPRNPDEDIIRQQKIMDDVEDFKIEVLPSNGGGVKQGPWVEEWPSGGAPGMLPLALRINLELENREPVYRLFRLSQGGLGTGQGG